MEESAFVKYDKLKKKREKHLRIKRIANESSTDSSAPHSPPFKLCLNKPFKKSPEQNPASVKKLKKKIKITHEIVEGVSSSTEEPTLKKLLAVENNQNCPAKKAVKLLTWLLYPVEVKYFFETHWESHPVHIIRNQSDYFEPLLTSTDVDKMLREHPLFFGRNVDIVKFKDGVRKTLNPEGRASTSIVWDAYEDGCSVRILNPQTYNDKVYFILATLQEYFGTMVGANVYLTPPGSQGFAPHFDDIEAFVIQLEGKKHWKLYKPMQKSDNLTRVPSKDFADGQAKDIIFDAVLSAGDVLYFPRGIVHEAKALHDVHSLHLTVSSYQRTCYADLFEALLPNALQTAVLEDISFRKGLPLDYLKHVGSIHVGKQTPERMHILKTVQALFHKLANSMDVDYAVDLMGQRFMHDALPPVLDVSEKQGAVKMIGHRLENGRVINKIEFTMSSEIRLVRYYACHFVRDGDAANLYFSTQNSRVYHGEEEQYISMNSSFGTIIEVLYLHYPDFVPLSAIPMKNKRAMIEFVTQLWDYEIIVTKDV